MSPTTHGQRDFSETYGSARGGARSFILSHRTFLMFFLGYWLIGRGESRGKGGRTYCGEFVVLTLRLALRVCRHSDPLAGREADIGSAERFSFRAT